MPLTEGIDTIRRLEVVVFTQSCADQFYHAAALIQDPRLAEEQWLRQDLVRVGTNRGTETETPKGVDGSAGTNWKKF